MDQKELEITVREIRRKLSAGESLSRVESRVRSYHMNEGLCHACYGDIMRPFYNERRMATINEDEKPIEQDHPSDRMNWKHGLEETGV